MTIDKYTALVDENLVRIAEAYVLTKVRERPSAIPLSPEFCIISIEDRQYCYDHLAEWVEQVINGRAL